MATIQRECSQSTFTAPGSAPSAGVTGTQGIPFGSFSSGEVRIPNGSSITTISWYSGDGPAGPWYQCIDVNSVAVVANQAAAIPPGCFGCKFLLPVANTQGTINIDLKG